MGVFGQGDVTQRGVGQREVGQGWADQLGIAGVNGSQCSCLSNRVGEELAASSCSSDAGQRGDAALVCRVCISVPATSANLGSGFDAVGLALDLRDSLVFERRDDPDELMIDISGEGEADLPRDERHLVVRAFRQACQELGVPRMGLRLQATNRIPQSRGLGSSAEAIVAGVAAAVAFSGAGQEGARGGNSGDHGGAEHGDVGHDDTDHVESSSTTDDLRAGVRRSNDACHDTRAGDNSGTHVSIALDKHAIFRIAARIEGHPDNVAPAVFGGATISWQDETQAFQSVHFAPDEQVEAVVLVPDVTLSTSQAREALPHALPFGDAIRNIGRAALLPCALRYSQFAANALSQAGSAASVALGAGDDSCCQALAANRLLFDATDDRVHQPYRARLMPGSVQLAHLLRERGLAAAISGAGPSVLVLSYGDCVQEVASVVGQLPDAHNWRVLRTHIDVQGVQATRC